MFAVETFYAVMGAHPGRDQARLGAIESLDLALLVDRQDDGMSGRVHVETDHVFDLFGEFWIIGALGRRQAMWLEAMGIPQTLDGAKRDADGLGHRPAGPMGGFARRFGAGERQHFGDDAGRCTRRSNNPSLKRPGISVAPE